MIHPHTELKFINPEIGYGVVATKFIPKGTITWAFDKFDQCFTVSEFNKMDDLYQEILRKYSYRDNKGSFVLCWDLSRFINHSFNSNCISTAYNFELAVRDIFPGEELTDDYGYLNCSEPFECLPEAGTTRSCVLPDDLLHYYIDWDAKLLEAFRFYNSTDQPLNVLLEDCLKNKVAAIASRVETMDSILNCYYSSDYNKMRLKERLLRKQSYAF